VSCRSPGRAHHSSILAFIFPWEYHTTVDFLNLCQNILIRSNVNSRETRRLSGFPESRWIGPTPTYQGISSTQLDSSQASWTLRCSIQQNLDLESPGWKCRLEVVHDIIDRGVHLEQFARRTLYELQKRGSSLIKGTLPRSECWVLLVSIVVMRALAWISHGDYKYLYQGRFQQQDRFNYFLQCLDHYEQIVRARIQSEEPEHVRKSFEWVEEEVQMMLDDLKDLPSQEHSMHLIRQIRLK
jgi:hypothetical protein